MSSVYLIGYGYNHNFPDTPAADGGKKVFYPDVYITSLSNDTAFEWKKIGQLHKWKHQTLVSILLGTISYMMLLRLF